jgi:hypothetical protein
VSAAPTFPRAAAQAAASSALLTVGDFPAGWNTSPDDASGPTDKFTRQFAGCLRAPIDLFQAGPDNVQKDSPDFNSPDDTDASVSESISVATTAQMDQATAVLHQSNLTGCATTAFSGLIKSSIAKEAASEHLSVGNATVGQLSFPKLGQDTVGLSVTLPVSGEGIEISAYLDVVYVKYRNAQIELEFEDVESPFDISTAESIAHKAYRKLRGVSIPKA